MNTEEQILYTKDNAGALRIWTIFGEGSDIVIRYGQVGGSMQYQRETVRRGKSLRSKDEQMMSRMASRILKQRDKGYVTEKAVALRRTHVTNSLGLMKPMLAQKIEKVKNIDYEGAVTQPKFDGNRCLIYCDKGVNRAYSRNGKHVEAIQHILNDIEPLEGLVLDGELYCHGYPLQTIVSWIKRKQENTLRLNYHLYDVVAPALPYKERSDIIARLDIGSSIKPVYGDPIASHEEALANFRRYRAEGYEGAILRWGDAGYEDGKRSKSLVKIKAWHDDEFKVIGVIPSREGWAILVCETEDGNDFKVSAPGTVAEKYKIMINQELYIGKQITVEYANLTKDGIPFHPVAINFREDI